MPSGSFLMYMNCAYAMCPCHKLISVTPLTLYMLNNFAFSILAGVWDGAGLWKPFSCGNAVNTLRLRKMADISQTTFSNAFSWMNIWILINISLNYVPKGQINNIPALVQIMAWRRPGDKSLSESMMVSLLTHICVTRPQWVKASS